MGAIAGFVTERRQRICFATQFKGQNYPIMSREQPFVDKCDKTEFGPQSAVDGVSVTTAVILPRFVYLRKSRFQVWVFVKFMGNKDSPSKFEFSREENVKTKSDVMDVRQDSVYLRVSIG